MNMLLRPALALMNRASYLQKFALISLLFAVPLALLGTLYLTEVNSKIAFAEQELIGCEYLRPLSGLLDHTLQSWQLAHAAADGDAAAQRLLGAAQDQIDADLQALAPIDARLGSRLGTRQQLARLAEDWATLKSRSASMQARTIDDSYEKLVGDLRSLIATVGDQSNLILDPDLDSYYLMDAVLLKLPDEQAELARLRQRGEQVIDHGDASQDDRSQLVTLSGLVRSNIAALRRGFEVAFQNTAQATLRPALAPLRDSYFDSVERYLALIDRGLVAPRAVGLAPEAHRAAAAAALRASFQLNNGALDQLDQLLRARIAGFSQRKNIAVGVTTAILLLVLLVWLAFYESVMRTVRALAGASERMLAGDFSQPVLNENRDELGQVVRSFNSVAAALVASSAQQQAVLDNAADGIMTINADGTIASLNPAAVRIFGFGAAALVGQPIAQIMPPPHADAYRQVGLGREVIGRRADGSSFPLDLAISEMRLADQHRYIAIMHDLTERRRAAEDRARMQEQIIQAQAAALLELSTPTIPISDNVLVMPLIGALDEQRVQRVLATLLDGLERRRARVAILDITGVPVIDTQVANGLIMAAQAARLLGARVMLTGIRPEVAQTLVGLGLDLSSIVTHSTLQSGIADATGLRRGVLESTP